MGDQNSRKQRNDSEKNADHQKEILEVTDIYFRFFAGRGIKVIKIFIDTLTSYQEVLSCKTRLLRPRELGLHICNYICLFFCIIALSLDPLFCYTLVVNEDNKCLTMDTTLATIATVSRSAIDFFYVLLLIFQFRTSPASGKGNDQSDLIKKEKGNDQSVAWTDSRKEFVIACAKVWSYILFYLYVTVDVLVILPLPQVVIFAVLPKLNDSRVFSAIRSLNFIVIVQYVLRVIRICSLLKKVTRASAILSETAWANLSFYILSSHVVGAFWYLFSVERKATCWREACQNDGGVSNCSLLYCDHDGTALRPSYTYLNDSCSTQSQSAAFNFGIYFDALETGVVGSADFLHRISYCFWWGLKNLSSVGQNLQPSTYIWEIYFSVAISISGLVLYAFLLGNLQTYLHRKAAISEEMKSKGQEIELWMAFHSLPQELQHRFRQHRDYKWEETEGVDVNKILRKLPKDLRRDTKRHLCSVPLKKVPMLKDMDIRVLDAIYDHLKPNQYIEETLIFRKGEPLDEMLFITQGCLRTSSTSNKTGSDVDIETHPKYLVQGQFYGEEILNWVLNYPSLSNPPLSTKTVRAQTRVEVFVLRADELKNVVTKFWWLFVNQQRIGGGALSPCNLDKWKPRAAYALQTAWRRHHKRIQLRKSTRTDRDPQHNSALILDAGTTITTTTGPAAGSTSSTSLSSSSDRISIVVASQGPQNSSQVSPCMD